MEFQVEFPVDTANFEMQQDIVNMHRKRVITKDAQVLQELRQCQWIDPDFFNMYIQKNEMEANEQLDWLKNRTGQLSSLIRTALTQEEHNIYTTRYSFLQRMKSLPAEDPSPSVAKLKQQCKEYTDNAEKELQKLKKSPHFTTFTTSAKNLQKPLLLEKDHVSYIRELLYTLQNKQDSSRETFESLQTLKAKLQDLDKHIETTFTENNQSLAKKQRVIEAQKINAQKRNIINKFNSATSAFYMPIDYEQFKGYAEKQVQRMLDIISPVINERDKNALITETFEYYINQLNQIKSDYVRQPYIMHLLQDCTSKLKEASKTHNVKPSPDFQQLLFSRIKEKSLSKKSAAKQLHLKRKHSGGKLAELELLLFAEQNPSNVTEEEASEVGKREAASEESVPSEQ